LDLAADAAFDEFFLKLFADGAAVFDRGIVVSAEGLGDVAEFVDVIDVDGIIAVWHCGPKAAADNLGLHGFDVAPDDGFLNVGAVGVLDFDDGEIVKKGVVWKFAPAGMGGFAHRFLGFVNV